MQQRNTFLAIAVCLGILVAWQQVPKLFPEWFPPPPEVTEPAPDTGAKDAGPDAGATIAAQEGDPTVPNEAGSEGGTEGSEEGSEPSPDLATLPPAAPATQVVLSNEKVRATFTSHGAAVASWQLLGKQFEISKTTGEEEEAAADAPKVQVDLVEIDEKEALPFSTTFEEIPWPTNADYTVVRQDEFSVTFGAEAAGTRIEKTFSLDPEKPYELSLAIAVTGPLALTPKVHLAQTLAEKKEKGGFLSFLMQTMPDEVRPSCAFAEEVERRTYDEDELTFSHTGDLHWVGIGSRYFLLAIYPADSGADAGCHLEVPEDLRFRAALELPAIEDGGSATVEGYLGPKFKTQLAAYGHELERSIDFGWFGLLSIFLLYVMNFFQGLVGNWGIAIILLTVTVKTVLLPLTNWSMKSMERMRAISPKMKVLKEKYGKDQQRFQQEMMKMYREEGVSPFGGCLPMLLQFPIWIALYRTILNTAELYHTSFIPGWLEDLSAPESGALKILPLLMGVTMFFMQKMQPTPATGDDSQAKMQRTMIYMMPPFFTLIMYGLPSGLTLYIFVNNILSIGQQYAIRRKMAAETGETGETDAAAPAPVADGPKTKKDSKKDSKKQKKSGKK